MAQILHVAFTASHHGPWAVERISPFIGASLADAPRLSLAEGSSPPQVEADAVWTLRATTSNLRYTSRGEVTALRARQSGLGRPQATCAALIPIRKNEAWWDLAQDERRKIMEETSHHIAIGLEYLPAIARRLHHGREWGEPFDFLTWFDYAPQDAQAFEDLVGRLRASEEWAYVEREVDVRLVRDL